MSCCLSCCSWWSLTNSNSNSNQPFKWREVIQNPEDTGHLLHSNRLSPIIVSPTNNVKIVNIVNNTSQVAGSSRPSNNVHRRDSQKYYVQWNYGNLKKGLLVEYIEEVQDSQDTDITWINVKDADGRISRAPLPFLVKMRDIKEEPWYFLNINTRDQAELILMSTDPEDGIYLIRQCSKDEEQYVLSIKRQISDDEEQEKTFEVKHYIIYQKDGLFGREKEEFFVTLAAMIDQYISTGFLSKPCPKDQIVNIDPSEIEIGDELGSGAFGVVSKAIWRDRRVAVKHITREEDFTIEIKQVCQFNHPKIVNIYGANISSTPHFMVMEYMSNDTLKSYVHNNELTLQQQLYVLEQIADGMSFLEKYKVIHRDLAARNVLVGDANCVKIADFGLSRNLKPDDDYYIGTKTKLPVLWMAVECLERMKFTVKSDVWMFGILSMEVFKRGERPYAEFRLSRDETIHLILEGTRMSRPNSVPKDVYEMTKRCWERNPKNRPTFADLHEYFTTRHQNELENNS